MGMEEDDPFFQLNADSDSQETSSEENTQENSEEKPDSQVDDPFETLSSTEEQNAKSSVIESSTPDPFETLSSEEDIAKNRVTEAESKVTDPFTDLHLGEENATINREEPDTDKDPFEHITPEQNLETSGFFENINPLEHVNSLLDENDSGEVADDPLESLTNTDENAFSYFDQSTDGVATENMETNNIFTSSTSDINEFPAQDQNNFNTTTQTSFQEEPVATPEADPFDALTQKLESSQQFMANFQDQSETIQNIQGTPYPQTSPLASSQTHTDQSYMEALGEKLFFNKAGRAKASGEEKQEVQRKLSYLKNTITVNEAKYRKWEKKSKRWALFFRLLSSALAAVVTVLLGINVTATMRDYQIDWYINTVALIISAFISIIGVIQGFFDASEMYIKYTDTANKLEQLLAGIEYLELGGDYILLDDINAIKLEYDRIIESTFDYEMQVKADNQETANKVRQQGRIR